MIANRAHVGGQTHAAAYIEAKELDINVHKGKAKGKNIHITRLEHGEVYGDSVDITQALGGNIKAREIYIDICASHVTAIASKLIEIKKMQGSENKFIIDPFLQDDVKDNIEKNEKEIQKYEEELKELQKEIKHHKHLIQEGTPAFLEIKKRLLHYKKKGVKLPVSFVKKYKQFQSIQENYARLKKDYEFVNERLDILNHKTASFQDNIFDARVINKDRWVGYNEIIFKMIDPPMELVYKPKEGSTDKVFAVVEIDEDMYAIQPVKEEV